MFGARVVAKIEEQLKLIKVFWGDPGRNQRFWSSKMGIKHFGSSQNHTHRRKIMGKSKGNHQKQIKRFVGIFEPCLW